MDQLAQAIQNQNALSFNLNSTEPTRTPFSLQQLLKLSSTPILFNATNQYTNSSRNNQNTKFNYDIQMDKPEFKLTY